MNDELRDLLTMGNELQIQDVLNHGSLEMGVIDGSPVYLDYLKDGKFCLCNHKNEISLTYDEKNFSELNAETILDWAKTRFEELKKQIEEQTEKMKSIGYRRKAFQFFERFTPEKHFIIWDSGIRRVIMYVHDRHGVLFSTKFRYGMDVYEATVSLEKEFCGMEDLIYKNEKLRDLMI